MVSCLIVQYSSCGTQGTAWGSRQKSYWEGGGEVEAVALKGTSAMGDSHMVGMDVCICRSYAAGPYVEDLYMKVLGRYTVH